MRFQNQSASTSKRSDFIKAIIGVGLFVIVAVGYTFTFQYFGRILDFSLFWLGSIFLGVLAGGLLGYTFAKQEYELFEQVRIYVICGVAGIVLMPLLVFWLNRGLDFQSPRVQIATLESIKKNTGQPFGYVKGEQVKVSRYDFIILFEGQLVRFSTEENPFPNQEVGDEVMIPIHSGGLGIAYIGL